MTPFILGIASGSSVDDAAHPDWVGEFARLDRDGAPVVSGDLIPIKDAARQLDMAVTTLRGHVKAGDIAYVAIGLGRKRKRIKFTPDDIEAFKQERRRREIYFRAALGHHGFGVGLT